MANTSLATRISWASGNIDGIASIVEEFVQSSDLEVSRQAFACRSLLAHVSDVLDSIEIELLKMEPSQEVTS